MPVNRPPSPPPELPGYRYVQLLGGGGFADVFLYEQRALGRRVAVKVLLASESSPSVRAQFDAESTLMAALSTHPNIVSIIDASIAADGRPYLIMEYCSRPNLSGRYKLGAEPISVPDVVSIGIQVGGAVETVHRAGILHRDIKPANVLTTDYNRPALTDFGISVATGAASDAEKVGLSIPWAPPEMLVEEPVGDHRADVYSLAATLYTLLARRSPFERPGGSNSADDLRNRITRTQLPPLGRSDVPPSLERVLTRGMAKSPAGRWDSALQMARALQDVQVEQGWPLTQVDVFDENPGAAQAELDPDDDGRTRIGRITTIRAQGPAEATARGASGAQVTGVGVESTQVRGSRLASDFLRGDRQAATIPADTMVRTQHSTAAPAPATVPAKRRWPYLVAAGAAAAVLVGVGTAVLIGGTAPAPLPDTGRSTGTTAASVDLGVPEPSDLNVTRNGDSLTFTWRNPDPRPGDSFQWQRTDVNGEQQAQSVTVPSVVVKAPHACIQVLLVRDDGRFSDPAALCSRDG